jgi:hypothetical protein
MESSKSITAVEWLVDYIENLNKSGYVFHPKYNEHIVQQAKELESRQKDEFAIEFNEWLIIKCDLQPHGVYQLFGEEYTIKELLEIYKKEKGL